MADIKKEQERDELHRAIWAIADGLRGSVDGWDFKSYVLGMMFYRYISENLTNYINEGEIEAGNEDFDYANLSDEVAEQAREDLVKTKGFFILPSELFCNLRKKAAADENLNMTLETIFKNIEESAKGSESEDNFSGLFDDIDVNSNKLGATVAKRNANLVKLIEGVADMKLGNYKDHSIDAFGDAYEYLMSMYASNAGKSGGEFFTPQEVSELLTRIAVVGKTEVNKVYDPACGSGSLLLQAAKILGKENVRQGFFGQEINLTTYNLCRINMFLHDIDYDKFDIAHEDTLLNPQHWDDEPFEVIVSNPPYSIKWEGDDNPVLINDPRFSPAGVLAPKSKADMAFIMHSLSWLSTNGTAAIVCFPGVMYRGGAEMVNSSEFFKEKSKGKEYVAPPNEAHGEWDCISDSYSLDFKLIARRYIEKTKTESGCRYIPMSDEVYRSFYNILSNRKKQKKEIIIDGYAGFVLLDKDGNPKVAMHIQKVVKRLWEKYNEENIIPLPRITPHVFRHTFCTNMANAGMDLKSLQYLMGHSDVSVTLNVYTHNSYEKAEESMAKIVSFGGELTTEKTRRLG